MNEIRVVNPKSEWYQKWIGNVDDKLLCLQDAKGEFILDSVDERTMKYINNNLLDRVWVNHLIFVTLVRQ